MRSWLIAALALPVALVPMARQDGAHASPERVAQIQAQLERLNRQADQLVERYLQAKLQLDRTQETIDSLRDEAGKAEQALRAAQDRVGVRAAHAYVEGPGNSLAAVLEAKDPGETLDRVQLLDLLARQDGDLMATLDIARQNFEARKKALEATERRQAQQVAGLADHKAEVERTMARTEDLLAEVRAADRRRAAEAEARRRAAAAAAPAAPEGPAQPSLPNVPVSGAAAKAVAYARAQVGKPYQWGATGPGAFDCSGLTMMAWQQAGVSLPHSSAAQFDATTRVSRSELQPGDLVFSYSPISHVAIYIGGGNWIAATHTGDFVRVQPLGSSVVGYGRPAG